MNAYDAVIPALHSWGSHPAFIEISSAGVAGYTGAEQFVAQVDGTVEALRRHGIHRGQVVVMFLDNSTDFARIFFALLNLGAVPVPVNPAYRHSELKEIFTNSQPQAVIAEQTYLGLLEPYTEGPALLYRSSRGLSLHHKAQKKPVTVEIDPWLASINYTYRGYGYPIGAMLPHDQYIDGAHALQDGLLGQAGEKMLVILPMSHIFTLVGCLFVPLLFGLTVVILRTLHPRVIFESLLTHSIDYITAVPEVLKVLARVKDNRYPLPSLKAFVSGGSVLDKDSYEQIRASFAVDLMHGYGLTEFAPVSRNIRGKSRGGTIGPVCRGVSLKLGSVENDGEALIKTAHMARGYFNRPGESAAAFEEGWFKTGDLLSWRKDHLVFVRESKNTCKVNGSMVDLEEVKKAVLSFPEAEEANISIKDNQLTAIVELRSQRSDQGDILRIKEFLRGRIAEYKIPKRIMLKSNHGRAF